MTRIRLFGPEVKPPRYADHQLKSILTHPRAATQKNLASTKPASRPERSLVSKPRPRESPKRPWREAARARGATQQQTQTFKPPAPISRTQPPPAPLQLTKPKPFAFAQPRVPVERAQDVVKPHERAKDIAARKAVFERQAHRPSVTVPEVGRTPGRLIRQRIEERRLFELGLRQREDEKRKAKEEAERERLVRWLLQIDLLTPAAIGSSRRRPTPQRDYHLGSSWSVSWALYFNLTSYSPRHVPPTWPQTVKRPIENVQTLP